MASSSLLPNPVFSSSSSHLHTPPPFPPLLLPFGTRNLHRLRSSPSRSRQRSRPPLLAVAGGSAASTSAPSTATSSPLHALIFDCDGVILESEHLHRQAYNDTFAHFDVRCPSLPSAPVNWGLDFYDELQNRIGGGKPKMRWYFGEKGWPSSTIFETPPSSNSEREKLIDELQRVNIRYWAAGCDLYSGWCILDSCGIRLPYHKRAGSTESSRDRSIPVRLERSNSDPTELGRSSRKCGVLGFFKGESTLGGSIQSGIERFWLDPGDSSFHGDDVKEKKPDPSIYLAAAKKLNVLEKNCLVVEDSVIGLQAATRAGMSCIVTYTSSTANQDFTDAIAKYPDLSNEMMAVMLIAMGMGKPAER
ncbi:hypothetical protein Taro_007682 [Colocasia esculenta]|uniref:Uncharacterized protein n=1 Tax=Colocasia esculenta TaxID=4460 RepID=A0A843U4N4_COLES|nr:hypothetical protein [Colocasia esculenta]